MPEVKVNLELGVFMHGIYTESVVFSVTSAIVCEAHLGVGWL